MSRTLLVEDDDTQRRLMEEILSRHGVAVSSAGSVEEAIRRAHDLDPAFLVTDYDLPDGTGEDVARALGLPPTSCVLVTARPNPSSDGIGWVFNKPLDLTDVRRIAELCGTDTPSSDAIASVSSARASSDGTSDAPSGVPGARAEGTVAPDDVRLVLYVTGASPLGATARRNLEETLRGFERAALHLTVHDLESDPRLLDAEDRVTFTPCLVRQRPAPRVWIVGDLSERALVVDLLESSGLTRKALG